jgi:L,D-peptidoglycan transpeptidase YkuD (ErfK/YbiS/YcfS/YnhG family)
LFLACTVIVALTTVGTMATIPVFTGRTAAPEHALLITRESVEVAQAVPRTQSSARISSESADLLAQAEAEYLRQRSRLLPLRDFREARVLLQAAEAKSHQAVALAQNERKAVQRKHQASVRAALQGAREMVAIASAFAEIMPLDEREKATLGRARRALGEVEESRPGAAAAASVQWVTEAESLASIVATSCAARAQRFTNPTLVGQWKRQVGHVIAASRASRSYAIVVTKTTRELQLYRRGVLQQTYAADLGLNNVVPKRKRGDKATPEGRYLVVSKNAKSKYHKSLMLDYPNADDRRRARVGKRRRASELGSDIAIHGHGGTGRDWTDGCVAVTNDVMDSLFQQIEPGCPVLIVGSRGDAGRFSEVLERFYSAAGEETEEWSAR